MSRPTYEVGLQGRLWYVDKNGVFIEDLPSRETAITYAEQLIQQDLPARLIVRDENDVIVDRREFGQLDEDDEFFVIEEDA